MNEKQHNPKFMRRALFCIAVGTALGLLTYEIFLYFKIAIIGWNLGLIFAPLVAGYVETIMANRILGENLGAISAFILFIDTTIYSFILKNPTLGMNFITAGSILVILQAAFPTLVNYILLVVVGGVISKFIKRIKNFVKPIIYKIRENQPFHWETKSTEIPVEVVPYFDEYESNKKLNSLNFYFLTSSDMNDRKHDLVGIYQSEVLIERNKRVIKSEPELNEIKTLKMIKKGKDECLIKIANDIKNNGGNGILDLSMNYSLIGLNGENIQITAIGMGIKIH